MLNSIYMRQEGSSAIHIVQSSIVYSVQHSASVNYSIQQIIEKAGKIVFQREKANHFDIFVHYNAHFSIQYMVQKSGVYGVQYTVQQSLQLIVSQHVWYQCTEGSKESGPQGLGQLSHFSLCVKYSVQYNNQCSVEYSVKFTVQYTLQSQFQGIIQGILWCAVHCRGGRDVNAP